MNYVITQSSIYASMIPTIAALVAARNGPTNCAKYELEDTVLRAGQFAWDLKTEAEPLHVLIAECIEAEATIQAEQAASQANYVPQSVTPWQMRRALNQTNLRDTVEAAVAAADLDTRDGWEFALEIKRDNPLLAGMAAALGMSEAQLDDLFRLAASFQ